MLLGFAKCQAVDSRDTKIEPVPPGIPKKKEVEGMVSVRIWTRSGIDERAEGKSTVRTPECNCEQRIAVITTDKQVEHDSGRACDHHRAE